ncbi:hypothetical protein ACPCA8_34140 [Streptomyces capoamus]|uniref:hypothetical protein n=1 Tax=Streptomyces capoamus TaxID=68183 RepID=UPI003C2FEE69
MGGDEQRGRGAKGGSIPVPTLKGKAPGEMLFLGYGLQVRALDTARPGPCKPGSMTFGTLPPMPLSGTIKQP